MVGQGFWRLWEQIVRDTLLKFHSLLCRTNSWFSKAVDIFVSSDNYWLILDVMRCTIWYHLYNLKNVKNTHGAVLNACNITKSSTPPWVLFTFFELYKCYQIAENI